MATQATKWSIQADYLQACNCDYGCPCEFEAPPTMGFCEGMGVYHISRGQFGDLSLDGLSFAFGIKFPAAMHKGNGTCIWIIDSHANEKQRDAMNQIFTGKLGGMPFEVFPMLFSKMLPTQYAPIDFKLDGRNSSATIGRGEGGAIELEPIKNPVTGEAEQIRVEHATGFIFKSAECVAAREGRMNIGGFSISYPNKAGFVAKVSYSN